MQLEKPFFLLIAAKPNSGKSHLIRYIMTLNHADYHKDPFKYGVVFTNTSFNNGYDYIPSDYVHAQYNPDIIAKLMQIQIKNNCSHRAFCLFDDCLPLKGFNSQVWIDLATQFRHYNISLIVSTQYIYRIPPTQRECCTHFAMFYQATSRSINACYETIGSYFDNQKEFSKFITERLGNHKFVLFDTRGNIDSNDKNILYPVMTCPPKVKEVAYQF
jgi:hypothetical protein